MKKQIIALFMAVIMLIPQIYVSADTEDVFAYAEFSRVSETRLMEVSLENKKEPTVVEKYERAGWSLSGASSGDSTINIFLDESYTNSSDDYVYEVEIDYLYDGLMNFVVAYNSKRLRNTYLGDVQTSAGEMEVLSPVSEWRTAKFKIYDANFNDKKEFPDIKISTNWKYDQHGITKDTDTPYGTKYPAYYLDTLIFNTIDPAIIGGVRIKKTGKTNPFSGDIKTARVSNSLFDTEEAKFDILLENKGNRNYDLNAKYEVIDKDENIYATIEETISIGANEEKELSVKFDKMIYGTNMFRATYSCDGVEFVKEVPFSYNKDASKRKNLKYGTNVHFSGNDRYYANQESAVELIDKAGYGTVRDIMRIPFFRTGVFGEFKEHAPSMDFINKFVEKGIDVLPIIHDSDTGKVVDPNLIEEMRLFSGWNAEIAESANSYAVEAPNEYHWIYPTVNAEEYVGLIKPMYEGIKEKAPELKFMGMNAAGLNIQTFKEIFELGGLDYMDGVSYHPYHQSRSPETGSVFTRGKSVTELMASYTDEPKENWVTEIGWPIWLGNPITEEESAAYFARTILGNEGLKTFDRIYHYQFADSGYNRKNKEHYFGIVKNDYADIPHEAYLCYPAVCMANYMVYDTEFVGDITGRAEENAENYVYRFKRNNSDGKGKDMIAAWTVHARYEQGIDLGTDKVYLYDMYGNETELYGIDGKFSFMLTETPIYIVGDFNSFKSCVPPIKVDDHTFNGAINDMVTHTISASSINGAKIVNEGKDFFEVVSSADFENGSGSVQIKTPSNQFFGERFDYRIEKDGKTYYRGSIKIDMSDTVTMDVTNSLSSNTSSNRWRLDISLTNNRNSADLNGVIKVNSPTSYAKYISDIKVSDVKPRETRIYTVFLPKVVSKEMQKFSMTLNMDNGEVKKFDKSLFFTPVPRTENKPVIDGIYAKGEYDSDAWFDILPGDGNESVYIISKEEPYMGADDLSAKASMVYDDENLYVFVEMTDDIHFNDQLAPMVWDGDGIQLGIADEGTMSGTYNELSIGKCAEGDVIYRHGTNNTKSVGLVENCEIKIVREGNKTRYEMRLPWEEILKNPDKVKAGYKPRFALLLNEDDGPVRSLYIEYSQELGAVGTHKNVSFFTDAVLGN